MQLGIVEGSVVGTIGHKSLKGWKLLIVQPIDIAGRAEGDPILAIDSLGAGRGTHVVISNDGRGARELVGDETSPARWSVIGLRD